MARRNKTTAKRGPGRPPKNAAPKARRARKTRGTTEPQAFMSPGLGMTPAQEAANTRHQALYMSLELRKLTQGVPATANDLIKDAETLRSYIVAGLPDAGPAPATEPGEDVVGPGADTVSDTGGMTLPLAAE